MSDSGSEGSRSPSLEGSVHSGSAGSPFSQHSGSPPGSPQSIQSVASPDSPRSEGSNSHSSRSASPARSASGSPRSFSGSPARSGSPRSGSESPARSGSISPRSESPASHQSQSPPGTPRSRSESPGTPRSRSESPGTARSRSGSRSRSESPAHSAHSGSRSRSGSPVGSPRSRSSSVSAPGSPATPQSDGSEGSETGRMTRKQLQKKNPMRRLSSGDEGSLSDGSHRSRASHSDNEEDGVGATVDDLFGDASDISSDDDDKQKASGDEQDEDDKKQVPLIQDDENQEVVPEEVPETRIEVEIPKVSTDLGSGIHFVKLPNFLSVETRPYDPVTYEDEVDDDDVMDEEGRTRLRLKVENTIRWRNKKDDDGNELRDELDEPIRESNARVVKWSDGSMSLHLGNEIFDIHTMLLQGDYNHLFIRQGTGLQGQSVFKTKLSFRPHSTDSFTHRKMTMSLADKSTKAQKVKVLPMAGADPEANKTEMIKKEEERLRASVRREAQQRRMKERAHSRGLNRGYLEDAMDDDDNENTFNIGAMKKAYKSGGDKPARRQNIYSSDENSSMSSASSDEENKSKKLMKAKKIVESEDEASVGSPGGSDGSKSPAHSEASVKRSLDSDSDGGPSKKKTRVLDSDSDED